MSKGILLAGGTGSRLYPCTVGVNKHLLTVYDKPMIYYPLTTLMLAGVKDVLLIATPEDLPIYKKLLGDGSNFGITITFAVQDAPRGIAEAFLIAEDFLQGEPVWLILGDNIFFGHGFVDILNRARETNKGATVFSLWVRDPERFGVVEFEPSSHAVKSIEEKPANPKSNYAAVGLYYYDANVVEMAKQVKPSARGELEITALNNLYLEQGKLAAMPLQRGFAWFDTGTPASLNEASNYFATMERLQGLKAACPEEVAYFRGLLNAEQLAKVLDSYPANASYTQYLRGLNSR